MMDADGMSRGQGETAPFETPTARAVLDMLGRAERAIEVDPRQARVFLDQAVRLLEPNTNTPVGSRTSTPGLAPWQERKILRHLGEHLCRPISNRDLAVVTGLSVGHFSRRFRGSFGVAPREYVIRSRLEHAKALMRHTRSPLCQIALASGFADQAHMSRTFHAIVGVTPTRWRREQAPDPALGLNG